MRENNRQKSISKKKLNQYTFEELRDCADNEFKDLNAAKLARTSPYEVGSLLERLSPEDRQKVLKKLSEEDTSDVLAEMYAEDSAEIISEMRDSKAIKVLQALEPDDAAGLLRELDDDDRKRLLSKMARESADVLRDLLTYDPDTAGGVMNPCVLSVRGDMNCDEAIQHLRKSQGSGENIENIYVIDGKNHLVGVLSINKLLWTASNKKISDIMHTTIEGVCMAEQDKESAAKMMAQFHHNTLPVIDSQGCLIGIITHDDVIDIIQEEATEDIQKLHGAGGDETIHDGIIYSVIRRTPWLIVNLFIAFFTARVISAFEAKISELTILAVFMNLIASLGGNSGAQTLAISIRSFALGEYHPGDSGGILLRETFKGLLNGTVVGIIAALITGLWACNAMVGVVVFVSMIANMSISGLVGAFIPIFLKRIRCDPAQSSYIFLTMVTDSVGMFIFLSIGSKLLL
ncbi:MAG: magnesium transporter [Puniceicoccales bacterium]|jgi:magnesium transporter|nr:magnesium transporter [Puniceicoccales bacterium]